MGFPRITILKRSEFPGNELYNRKENSFGGANVKGRPRAIWMRAISNVTHRSREGAIRGDRNIIVGGLLLEDFSTRGSFETLYRRPKSSIKDRPIPGITGISITSKGEYQQLRKVNITWECPSFEDLDELSPYWLSPGGSVWLEWGWSEVGKNVHMSDISPGIMSAYYNRTYGIYEDIVMGSGGNQDGYIGVITNFSFNQNDDGGWTCTTELTSMGSTLLVLDLNRDKVYQGSSLNDTGEKTQTIKGFINENFTEDKLRKLSFTPFSENGYGNSATWISKKDIYIADLPWYTSDKIYVSWRFIEEAIINQHAALTVDNGNPLYKIDSSDSIISNDPLLFSTSTNMIISHTQGTINNFNNGNDKEGKMRNIYVEIEYLKEIFENSETLEEALNKTLRGISEAACNYWDFKLQPKDDEENTIEVIDMNFMRKQELKNLQNSVKTSDENEKVLSLGGYSGKSLLTSISFTSKLTDQLALKYVVGRNKNMQTQPNLVVNGDNDGGVNLIFGEYPDRVINKLKAPPSPPESPSEIAERAAKELEEQEKTEQKRKDYVIGIQELTTAIRTGEVPSVANSNYPSDIIIIQEEGKELLIEYLNRERDGNGNPTNETRFSPIYPLEISVTIDGMSGMLPGHCFTVDNLPKLYRNSGVFQVVEVSHDVNGDDWQTTLRAFFRVTKTLIGG